MMQKPSEYFLSQMKLLYDKKMANSIMMDRLEYHAKIERMLELNNPQIKRLPSDFRLLKAYEVHMEEENGMNVPKLCKRGTKAPYIPIEDLYDTIHSAHIRLSHAGRNGLQVFLRTRYSNITKDCIMEYLKTCTDCPRRKRPLSANKGVLRDSRLDFTEEDDCTTGDCSDSSPDALTQSASRHENTELTFEDKVGESRRRGLATANASVISTSPLSIPFDRRTNDIKRYRNKSIVQNRFTRAQTEEPDGEFYYILCYTNLSSREVRLRPLRTNSINESANNLIDIYCDCGAPIVLQVGAQSFNGRNFIEGLVIEIARLWPQCKQIYSKSMIESRNDVHRKLMNFKKEHGSVVRWASILRHVQWEINTTYDHDIGCSPIERSQGKMPQLGLPQSKLLDAIYEKVHSEDEILDYLQDAELLRLSAFCQQSRLSSSLSENPTPFHFQIEKRQRLNSPPSGTMPLIDNFQQQQQQQQTHHQTQMQTIDGIRSENVVNSSSLPCQNPTHLTTMASEANGAANVVLNPAIQVPTMICGVSSTTVHTQSQDCTAMQNQQLHQQQSDFQQQLQNVDFQQQQQQQQQSMHQNVLGGGMPQPQQTHVHKLSNAGYEVMVSGVGSSQSVQMHQINQGQPQQFDYGMTQNNQPQTSAEVVMSIQGINQHELIHNSPSCVDSAMEQQLNFMRQQQHTNTPPQQLTNVSNAVMQPQQGQPAAHYGSIPIEHFMPQQPQQIVLTVAGQNQQSMEQQIVVTTGMGGANLVPSGTVSELEHRIAQEQQNALNDAQNLQMYVR